jgi:hypothetical protein
VQQMLIVQISCYQAGSNAMALMIQISLVIMLDYAANAYASNFFEPVVLGATTAYNSTFVIKLSRCNNCK